MNLLMLLYKEGGIRKWFWLLYKPVNGSQENLLPPSGINSPSGRNSGTKTGITLTTQDYRAGQPPMNLGRLACMLRSNVGTYCAHVVSHTLT